MGKRIPIIVGLLFVLFSVWIQISKIEYLQHYITRLESLAYDVQLRTKIFTHKKTFQSTVALVDIDDKSLDKEGRWPWPRSKLAALLTNMQQAGAVVVTFDMLFPEPERNIVDIVLQTLSKDNAVTPDVLASLEKIKPLFNNDEIFAESLKQGDVELGISFLPRVSTANKLPPPLLQLKPEEKNLEIITAKGYIGNIPILQSAAKSAGFVNVFGDEDGIIRSVPLLLRYQDAIYPSLALEAVRLFLLSNIKLGTAPYGDKLGIESVTVGNHVIPTDLKGKVIIPFRGKSFTFPYYSATDVLNKKIPTDALQGKIVIVGTSATGGGDLQATSVGSAYPGMEIQATIADGILNDSFSYRPGWALGAELVLTLLLGVLFSFFFPFLGPRLLALTVLSVPFALLLLNNWLWDITGIIISIFIPVFLVFLLALFNIIYGYLFETRRREQLKEMFGQYVPAKHIDEMLKGSSGKTFGALGETRNMTVLFADIRNFTGISEKLTAIQLKEMLNDFFTPMTEIIFNHTGTIDKYVGDLIMAFWGAPLRDKKHAEHGVAAALEMQKKISSLQPMLKEHGWPEINIGIGLNTGEMNVGDMGSKFRRNYTVLGDAVNLASRVEGLTKFYNVKIIVTEFTKANQEGFAFRQLDRVRVKGKLTGVNLFEPLCRISELTPALNQELAQWSQVLDYYFNREWEKANEILLELAIQHSEVTLYTIYLDRIKKFMANPPPEDWGGVFVHKEK